MINLYLGIDPGVSGAWAVINDESHIVANGQTVDEFLEVKAWPHIEHAYLESQGLRHSDMGGKQFYIQKLLINFGMWQGALKALEIPYALIAPMTWMARWGCAGRMPSNLRKKSYLAVARRLWPERKFLEGDHDLAAALLLSELARVDYGRI